MKFIAPHAPLDPFLAGLVELGASRPALHDLPVGVAREAIEAMFAPAAGSLLPCHTEDRSIPGPGGDLTVRIYRPESGEPRPVVVYFHGGGFVLMSIETHDGICRQLCNFADCVVVSVGYRLAPEFPFPAAVDDALAALRWCAANAASLGGDPARLALAGDSAGGNLAIVTAIQARNPQGPPLRGVLLFYPALDAAANASRWPSRIEFAEGHGLGAATMEWFLDHYLPDAALRAQTLASPIAADLKGLPPVRIVTAGYDVLRDEGEAFGVRLEDAGVPCMVERFGDLNHAFLHWAQEVPNAMRALRNACSWLEMRFSRLGAYDPVKHGGQFVGDGLIGVERS